MAFLSSLWHVLSIRWLLFQLLSLLSTAIILRLHYGSCSFYRYILKVFISLRSRRKSIKYRRLSIWLLKLFIFRVIWRSLIGGSRLLLRSDWAWISSLLLNQLSLSLPKLMLCLLKLFKQFNLFLHGVWFSKLHLHILLLNNFKLFLH